ncbi:MAG: hypothetical protein WA979_10780 [Pacificimonas sp.]
MWAANLRAFYDIATRKSRRRLPWASAFFDWTRMFLLPMAVAISASQPVPLPGATPSADPAPDSSIAYPLPDLDTDGDGTADAWDFDGDGNADAWDDDDDGFMDRMIGTRTVNSPYEKK